MSDRPAKVPEDAQPAFGGALWVKGNELWVRKGKSAWGPKQLLGMTEHVGSDEELMAWIQTNMKQSDGTVHDEVFKWLRSQRKKAQPVRPLPPEGQAGLIGWTDPKAPQTTTATPPGSPRGPVPTSSTAAAADQPVQETTDAAAPQAPANMKPIDMACVLCHGRGCPACFQTGKIHVLDSAYEEMQETARQVMAAAYEVETEEETVEANISEALDLARTCPNCNCSLLPNDTRCSCCGWSEGMARDHVVEWADGRKLRWREEPKKKTTALVVQDRWWENQEAMDLIRGIVGKNASDFQVKWLFQFSKALGLNPLIGETQWSTYFNRPVIDRDGYVSHANRHPSFRGMISGVVYEGDVFSYDYKTGDVTHEMKGDKDPKKIRFAFAVVHRNDRDFPFYYEAPYKEFMVGGKKGFDNYPGDKLLAKAQRKAIARAFNLGALTEEDLKEGDTGGE